MVTDERPSIPFDEITDEQAADAARMIEIAVHCDPARYLHQAVTPFASVFDLMGGPPPARWRLWARARWRDRLFQRALQEMIRQREFARHLARLAP